MNPLGSLSPDEREVVELTVAGNSDHAIAWHLGIPISVVQDHRTAATTRLGAGTFAELVPLTLASWGERPQAIALRHRMLLHDANTKAAPNGRDFGRSALTQHFRGAALRRRPTPNN